MKFSYKILLSCIITMAAALGIGGYFFVNDVFEASMEREMEQAADESNILQFAFETAALNIPAKYDLLQNSAVKDIGANLEKRGQGTSRLLRFPMRTGRFSMPARALWRIQSFWQVLRSRPGYTG